MTDENLPRTQMEAVAAGSMLYFTGRPCKRGHQSPRYAVDTRCRQCNRERCASRQSGIRIIMRGHRAAALAAAAAEKGA